MRGWWALTRAMGKQLVHDKTAVFFYFLFPLMFLVLFGLLFGNPNFSKVSLGVSGSGPIIDALPSDVFKIERYEKFSDALDDVESGRIPAAINGRGDVADLRYSQTEQVASATVQGVLQSVVNDANLKAADAARIYSVDSKRVERDSYEPIQFLTSGLLSWGVAMSAAFGASLNLVTWRKSQVLRRLRLSPVSPLSIVAARVVVGLAVAFLQGAVFILVAMTPPFGLQLSGSWWLTIPLLAAGTLAFMSIGLLVGSVVRSEEGATGAVNLIILPMAFLSGAFFDVSAMPEFLERISWALPMRHLNSALLDVLVRNETVGSIVVPMSVLLGFTVVFTAIASRFFSWEDTP